jgi:hypothetical protein
MITSYGYTDYDPSSFEARNRIEFPVGPLHMTWQHCSQTAEFLGEFFAVQARQRRFNENEARYNIAYLANELLENVVKFRTPGDVELESAIDGSTFRMMISNWLAAETASRFQGKLKELLARDPGELLIERIEANAAEPLGTASGLGLLTLMNDYGARLGWTFRQTAPGEPIHLRSFAALALV